MRKVWNGQARDNIGVILLTINIILVILAFSMPPAGIFLGWDPPYYIFNACYPDFCVTHPVFYTILLMARLVYMAWLSYEGCRISATVIQTCILVVSICVTCINNLCKRTLNESTLWFYHQLHCIVQTGMDLIRLVAGALLAIGLILSVILHWAVTSGWNKLPAEVYVLACACDIAISSVIGLLVPLGIRSNELSVHLLGLWNASLSNFTHRRRYWRRVVRAERPMAIYYATTKFEKSTRANYYCTIVDYTVNLMLLTG